MLFDAKHDRLITGTKRIKAVSMAVFEAQRYVDPAVIFVGEGEGGGSKEFWAKGRSEMSGATFSSNLALYLMLFQIIE